MLIKVKFMTKKIDLATAKKQALTLHQQGHLIQAEQGYQSILAIQSISFVWRCKMQQS